jgi:hypothetical protein
MREEKTLKRMKNQNKNFSNPRNWGIDQAVDRIRQERGS